MSDNNEAPNSTFWTETSTKDDNYRGGTTKTHRDSLGREKTVRKSASGDVTAVTDTTWGN